MRYIYYIFFFAVVLTSVTNKCANCYNLVLALSVIPDTLLLMAALISALQSKQDLQIFKN